MIAESVLLALSFSRSSCDQHVESACAGWKGAPYREGGRSHRGIDCVNFGSAVLDNLYGFSRRETLIYYRGDACLHNPIGVKRAMKALLRTYPNHKEVVDRKVRAGDILVTGPSGGGPGHLMLIGGVPGRIWHCTSSSGGVSPAGYSLPIGHELFKTYRMTDREKWC